MISMNSSSVYNTSSTRQSSDSSSGLGDAINPILAGSFGFLALSLLFSLTIFVIWVWSMISMINLNIRFKDFLEDYRRGEGEKESGNVVARKQNSISSVDFAGRDRLDELSSDKSEEQRKVERAEMFAKMKPRKFYVWAAISVPILLVILVVVVNL